MEKEKVKKISKIIKFLFIILCVLCIIGIVAFPIITINNNGYVKILESNINLLITNLIIYITSIPALLLLIEFVKLFSKLEKNEIFNQNNIKYLKRSSIYGYIIGALYILGFITFTIMIIQNQGVGLGLFSIVDFFILVIAIIFIIIGTGLKFLSKIYKEAVENKEENDLTI